jgi:hypothetical protein
MTRRRTLWLFFAIGIGTIGFYLWGSSATPPGQPPLVSLTETNVSQFQCNGGRTTVLTCETG